MSKTRTLDFGGLIIVADEIRTGAKFPGNIPSYSNWNVVYHSSNKVDVTGTTDETTTHTVKIPGGALGKNGRIMVDVVVSQTNSANNKTYRVKYAGTTITTAVLSTVATHRFRGEMWNTNSTANQRFWSSGASWTAGSTAMSSSTLDTSVDQNLTVTIQLASSGETASIESVIVYVLRGD